MYFLSPFLHLLAAIVSYLIASDLLERTARWTCISIAGFVLRASRHIGRFMEGGHVYGGLGTLWWLVKTTHLLSTSLNNCLNTRPCRMLIPGAVFCFIFIEHFQRPFFRVGNIREAAIGASRFIDAAQME